MFTDGIKASLHCAKEFRENMILQHANRMGVHKCAKRDALTCWGQGCAQCLECRQFKCYSCGEDLWACVCGPGNIRKNPALMDLHPEDYDTIHKR